MHFQRITAEQSNEQPARKQGGTMRSSSIKTAVAVLSITVALAAVAPAAEAKPSQSRSAGVTQRFQQAISQLMKRLGIRSDALPGDPIPAQYSDIEETTTTTTTSSPKRIR
jgi:hypothetical protein